MTTEDFVVALAESPPARTASQNRTISLAFGQQPAKKIRKKKNDPFLFDKWYPIGIEYTWMPEGYAGNTQEFKKALRSLNDKTFGLSGSEILRLAMQYKVGEIWGIPLSKQVHWDDGTLEVPTGPFMTERHFTRADAMLRLVARELQLLPYAHVDRFASGGGHIHVDYEDDEHLRRLMIDFYNRPYMNWFFNDPGAIGHEDNVWVDQDEDGKYVADALQEIAVFPMRKQSYKDERWGGPMAFRMWGGDWIRRVWPRLKSVGLRQVTEENPRVEFRIFAAARNEREQLLHVKFVQRYMNWVRDNPPTEVKVWTKKSLQKFTLKRAREEMSKFIKELGLDWDEYRVFLVNMENRFSKVYGKSYLR